MIAGAVLADTANIGLLACAVLDTAAVAAYAILDSGDKRGRWWATSFGVHLMCFMAAFAVVLDQAAAFMITRGGPLVTVVPLGRPDWFAWERILSFSVLLPAVLAWRLWFILRPPQAWRRRERP